MKKSSYIRLAIISILIVIIAFGYSSWSSLINGMLPADSRPGQIQFAVEKFSDDEFEATAMNLLREFPDGEFDHIERFRRAGIRSYEGPRTCLACHEEVQVGDAGTGVMKTVDLMENLLESTHYRFFTMEHPNVYGFNGELADNFPICLLYTSPSPRD